MCRQVKTQLESRACKTLASTPFFFFDFFFDVRSKSTLTVPTQVRCLRSLQQEASHGRARNHSRNLFSRLPAQKGLPHMNTQPELVSVTCIMAKVMVSVSRRFATKIVIRSSRDHEVI